MKSEVYLAGAVRSPIGVFGGALEPVPAPELGGIVARAAVQRAGISPD